MENFGLFQLLNSLLPKPAEPSAPKAEKPPTENKTELPKPPVAPPPANACLDFFERHEKRARRH